MDKMEKCRLKISTYCGLGITPLYFPPEFGNNQDGEVIQEITFTSNNIFFDLTYIPLGESTGLDDTFRLKVNQRTPIFSFGIIGDS